MKERTLRLLEFPKILERLAQHTSFSASKELALNLCPSPDVAEVRLRLQATSEARRLLDLRPSASIGRACDIRHLVQRAELGGMLEPTELLDVEATLASGRSVHGLLTRLAHQLPTLALVAQQIEELPALRAEIARCIDQRGEVVDRASETLTRIRTQLRVDHQRLVERLNDLIPSADVRPLIQEPIITLREGRYVLPIKVELKSRFPGIVHDQSASGATFFMEPLATVELNNRWREGQLAERHEVERILRRLTELVAAASPALRRNVEALAEIDLALAKARYSAAIRGVEPQLVTGAGDGTSLTIQLKNARHPLLSGQVVPINFWLGGDFHILVITGPNTGGKTVALKTVGLLTLMAQAGLHIPADEGSQVRVFRGIYADIGDEQSIEQSLSTFSSHMSSIIEILREADDDSLVLLDEIGAGTDPVEGSALARALLSHLRQRGISTVATTHYSELKTYAYATPGIENACVEFDVETLVPTYHLTIGLPGRSNALAIAARLGLPSEIEEGARALLSPSQVQVEGLLAEIRREHERAAAEREQAERARAEAEKLRDRLAARLSSIEEERQEVLYRARQSFEAEVADLRERLRHLAEAPEAAQAELVAAVARGRKAEEALVVAGAVGAPAEPSAGRPRPQLRSGDLVRVRHLRQEGELLTLPDQQGETEVQLGSFKLRMRAEDLELTGRTARHPATTFFTSKGPPVNPQMEVRGWRADEVGPELDRYLNDAYLAGLPYVRIVHGKGTGVLRQVVRELLAQHPLVQSFQVAEAHEGGEGVTVAVLAR